MLSSWLHRAGRQFDGYGTCVAIVWVVLCACAAASADDPSAARGRRLFEAGIGSNGRPVDAVMSDSATPIPGGLLSCAGCHGHDGKGRIARGMEAPDITWDNLTKPYALRVGAGRVRPAYNDALLVRAVTTGHDSAGRPLSAAMPRFRLTPADATDLIAYLRELASRRDPGIGADVLSIGVIVPSRDRQPAAQEAVRTALTTDAEELNRAGGIFGRRIEFTFFDTGDGVDGAPTSERASLIEPPVLAFVSSGVAPEHLIRGAQQPPAPVIAAHADNDLSPPQHVFYLSAGVTGELAALAIQASRELSAQTAQIAVAYRDDAAGRDRIAALRPWIGRAGWHVIREIPLPATDSTAVPIEVLQQIESADAVLIATPDLCIKTILSHLEQADRYPLMLLPGSITAREWLPPTLSPRARIRFAFQSIDQPNALPLEHGIADRQQQVRLASMSAQLLIEGLRRAGRKTTHAKLIEAIETIQRFETGYLPPLNYGPRQHIGFIGAHILAFDPQRRRLLQPAQHIRLD